MRLPEVATASKLNLRWTEARATLGSRVVSSSPLILSMSRVLKLSSRSKYCKGSQTTQNRFSDHPLVQMPKPDPRDNPLPGGDGKPACRLNKKHFGFEIFKLLQFHAILFDTHQAATGYKPCLDCLHQLSVRASLKC